MWMLELLCFMLLLNRNEIGNLIAFMKIARFTQFFFSKSQARVGQAEFKYYNFNNSLTDATCIHFVIDINFE